MRLTKVKMMSKLSDEEVRAMEGKMVRDEDYDVLLDGPSMVIEPGLSREPLVVYLPGVLKGEAEEAYPFLTKIRDKTDNRGAASGTERVQTSARTTRAKRVASSVLGSMDPMGGRFPYCRLTAYTARETDDWHEMRPLFQAIAGYFKEYVPHRYAAQVEECEQTDPDWVIPGTPFTTITVNNTYPTGIHTDKGDLDKGFSTLATIHRGEWSGGRLVFPQYRVGINCGDGDLCLMNAHEFHGNTAIICKCGRNLDEACPECGAERISVVSYFRTKMVNCGSMSVEEEKRLAKAEANNLGLLDAAA